MTAFLTGAVLGLAMLALATLLPAGDISMLAWIEVNLGISSWLFLATMLLFQVNLLQLQQALADNTDHARISFLDQLSDVWMHVFVGIGVIWTAVGMRDALVTTLNVPGGVVQDAGQVLGRLVDGGILLALTTTIVGALGGYVMRLVKTVSLGAALSHYYHQFDRREMSAIADRVAAIHDQLAGHTNSEAGGHAS